MASASGSTQLHRDQPGGRRVEPELLDQLSADDPRAIRSRRDLRRVNAWMGNARILGDLLKHGPGAGPPKSVVEIGGGDGTFLLGLARRLSPAWTGVKAWVIDRQNLVTSTTAAGFQEIGWTVRAVQSDVFDWLTQAEPVDVMLANLFLHHFADRCLVDLLELAAGKTNRLLAACEPHRFFFPTLAGASVVLIGCSAVTCHDAVASIRAGFVGQELSQLWSERRGWRLIEGKAGWFSHSFCASRD